MIDLDICMAYIVSGLILQENLVLLESLIWCRLRQLIDKLGVDLAFRRLLKVKFPVLFGELLHPVVEAMRNLDVNLNELLVLFTEASQGFTLPGEGPSG